jgi:Chemotaxis phosphatase CheX
MPQELDQADRNTQSAELGEVLRGVVAEVLETMFFTEAMAVDCEHSWISGASVVRVPFSGSHSGEMWLCVSHDVVASIAPAFLAQDLAETSEEERSQVILELANILCGAVLSRLWPESSLLLDAPAEGQWESPAEGALHCCFELPEGMLAISIRMCDRAEAA